MNTNNLFVDFLLKGPCVDEPFGMSILSNGNDFLAAFDGPVVIFHQDGQGELLEVNGPLFQRRLLDNDELVTLIVDKPIQVSQDDGVFPARNLGRLIKEDWYSDEFAFFTRPPLWCRAKTYEMLRNAGNIEIRLDATEISFTARIEVCETGFDKCGLTWDWHIKNRWMLDDYYNCT